MPPQGYRCSHLGYNLGYNLMPIFSRGCYGGRGGDHRGFFKPDTFVTICKWQPSFQGAGHGTQALDAWQVLYPWATPEAPFLVSSAPFKGRHYILTLSTTEKEENVIIQSFSKWHFSSQTMSQILQKSSTVNGVRCLKRSQRSKENVGAKGPPTAFDDIPEFRFSLGLYSYRYVTLYSRLTTDLFSLRQLGLASLCYEKVTLWNTEGKSWGAAEYSEEGILLVFICEDSQTYRMMPNGMFCAWPFNLWLLPVPCCQGKGRFYEEF